MFRLTVLVVMTTCITACTSRTEPPKSLPRVTHHSRLLRAFKELCPGAEDGPRVEGAVVQAASALARQEVKLQGDAPAGGALKLSLDLVRTPPAFDGYPPQWLSGAQKRVVCWVPGSEQMTGPAASQGCEDDGGPDGGAGAAVFAMAQLHIDCGSGRRALVFARPVTASRLPSLENPRVVFSDFDVWLDVRAQGSQLQLSGGCFPGWSRALQERLGVQGEAKVRAGCMPLYVPDGSGGYLPWHVVRAHPKPQ